MLPIDTDKTNGIESRIFARCSEIIIVSSDGNGLFTDYDAYTMYLIGFVHTFLNRLAAFPTRLYCLDYLYYNPHSPNYLLPPILFRQFFSCKFLHGFPEIQSTVTLIYRKEKFAVLTSSRQVSIRKAQSQPLPRISRETNGPLGYIGAFI